MCTDQPSYSAISCFALHPIYLRLDVFGQAMPEDWSERLNKGRKKLNALKVLDYEAVMNLKLELTREVFDGYFETISQDPGLQAFIAEHEGWLLAYAAFSVLRDRHGNGQRHHHGRQ